MKTESRMVGDFDNISVSKGIIVHLKQEGEAGSIEVEAENNIIEHVITHLDGNTLEVNLTPGMAFRDIQPIKVWVTIREIKSITATSGSSIIANSTLQGNGLNCSLSAGSNFIAGLSLQNLFLTLTGGSDVDVKGKAETARIDVSGGSQFKGKNLSIQQCDVIASGGSRAFVRAEKEISIVASGASKVRYHGAPQVLTRKASGVSKIKHKKI